MALRVPDAPSVELRPLNVGSGPVPTSDGGTGALARGAQQALGAANDIFVQQQKQRNADRLFRAEAQLGDAYRTFETSVKSREGQNAWGATNDAATWWDTQPAKISAELENDAQRELFDMTVAKMRGASLDSIASHESSQRKRSLEESAKAAIGTAVEFGAAHFADPAAVAESRAGVIDRIDALGKMNGWTAEQIAAERQTQLTNLHGQVIENLADRDPTLARSYFNEHKAEIAGSTYDRVEKLLETSDVTTQSQRAADAILAKGQSRSAAIKEAEKNYEGKIRDAVVARLDAKFNRDDAMRADAERNAADAAWKVFAEVGTVSKIPPSLLSRLDGKTILSMQAAEKSPAERVQTDWARYEELTNEAVTSPAAFAARDLRQDYNVLNEQERVALAKMQTSIRNGQQAGLATREQILNASLASLKIKKDSEQAGLFMRRFNETIAAEQQATGKEIPFDRMQQIADRLAMSGEVRGGGLFGLVDPDRRYFEVVGTTQEGQFDVEVPDSERQLIEAALTKAGKPIDDNEVKRLYLQRVGLSYGPAR